VDTQGNGMWVVGGRSRHAQSHDPTNLVAAESAAQIVERIKI
jgi:hypothetical protein